MNKKEETRPAEVFPPRDYILEEIEARGWSREALAEKMGLKLYRLDEILDGNAQVTRMVAHKLGEAFGTSAEVWTNLQAEYDKWGPA